MGDGDWNNEENPGNGGRAGRTRASASLGRGMTASKSANRASDAGSRMMTEHQQESGQEHSVKSVTAPYRRSGAASSAAAEAVISIKES